MILSNTLQGRFLLIVLPILLLTIGVVGYSQYLGVKITADSLEQKRAHSLIILLTEKVKEDLQDLELLVHRDILITPAFTPAIKQQLIEKNIELGQAYESLYTRLTSKELFIRSPDAILALANQLKIELDKITANLAEHEQWRTDSHLAINTVQPNFNAARFLIDEIEVYQLRYADVFLTQSHDIAQKISYLMWLSLFIVLAIIIVGYFTFEFLVRRPLVQVSNALNAEADGEMSILPASGTQPAETKLLIDAFINMREQVNIRQIRLQSILDNAAEGVITYDEDCHIESFNHAAETLFGYAENELAGQDMDILFVKNGSVMDPEYLEKILTQDNMAQQGESGLELDARRKDGTVFPLAIKISSYVIYGSKMYTAIVDDVSEHKAMIENLRRLAEHDGLTGLYNRYYFMQEVEHLVKRVERQGKSNTAVFYLDLDNFKYVNDTLGHIAGDELLVQITLILQKRTRRSDLLARIGGDEFAMILYDVGESEALEVAELFRQNIHDYKFMYQGETVDIGCSIGVIMVNPGANTEELLSRADYSCHAAKLAGKNKIHLYTIDDQKDISGLFDDIGWTRRIKQALQDDMFSIACQPIQNANGKIQYYEILLRMLDEEGNIIMPSGFIPPAERFGLMPSIDRWVIHHAILLLKYASKFTPRFSINLSAASFHDDSIIDFVTDEIKNANVDAQRLTFEITETIAMADLSMTAHNLRKLQELGCQTSLDDFGAGYSSYAYLKDLPVHYVKIDGSFITGLVNNKLNREIVQSMHNIAHIMGKETIAEFVESEETAKVLIEMGVDYLQGYYIGKPEMSSIDTNPMFSPEDD